MRVYNKSKRMFQHTFKGETYNLKPKSNIVVPDEVAKIWLATGEVVEYVDPQEAKKAQEEAAKKQADLEAENEKLKAELEKLKKADTKATKK